MSPIDGISDAKLRDWLAELESKGYYRLLDIPFNYYEIKAEVMRREQEKEA